MKWNIPPSFVPHFKAMGEFKLELQSGNTHLGPKSAIFCPVWHWNLLDDLEEQYGIFSIPRLALCIISKPSVNSSWSYSRETFNSGQNWRFFCPMWPWNLTNWPRKTIGHFFYAASNFVHHFIAISEFKLELQSGNAQFVSKSMIFFSRVALKWRMTDDLEKE